MAICGRCDLSKTHLRLTLGSPAFRNKKEINAWVRDLRDDEFQDVARL